MYRAQFNDQRRSWSISSLVLSFQCGVFIIISSIGKKSDKFIGILSDIFQWSIDIDIGNTFYGEYRYRYKFIQIHHYCSFFINSSLSLTISFIFIHTTELAVPILPVSEKVWSS